MADALEIKDGDCLEMCTPLPAIDYPKQSQVFSLEGKQWKIKFYDSGEYRAKISLGNNTETMVKPFCLDFSIGFKDEENPSLGKENMIFIDSSPYIFWSYKANDLLSRIPPNSSPMVDDIIKFVLHFHFPKEPTLKLICTSQDECSQTTSHADATSISNLCKEPLMLESALYHDVEINCGKQTIKAHRNILSTRSEVLQAMLQSSMVEGRTGILEIKDIDVDCIQDFVNYLHTDKLPELTFDKARKLYEVGDKYAVRSLMVICKEYLQDNLSRENACECLVLADTHHDKKLKDKVIAYILEAKLFLQDELWSPFCEQYPKIALDVYKVSYKDAY